MPVNCDVIPGQEVDENVHEIKSFMIKTVSLKSRLFFSERVWGFTPLTLIKPNPLFFPSQASDFFIRIYFFLPSVPQSHI